mmetsp:Transcript_43411/g.138518  ORF Transcript_43411/g.138518 Transcript_43411/m.138518 type:complete len:207 (-) Transcript_43411:769-1389(-)
MTPSRLRADPLAVKKSSRRPEALARSLGRVRLWYSSGSSSHISRSSGFMRSAGKIAASSSAPNCGLRARQPGAVSTTRARRSKAADTRRSWRGGRAAVPPTRDWTRRTASETTASRWRSMWRRCRVTRLVNTCSARLCALVRAPSSQGPAAAPPARDTSSPTHPCRCGARDLGRYDRTVWWRHLTMSRRSASWGVAGAASVAATSI